jgi:hypothetical protein
MGWSARAHFKVFNVEKSMDPLKKKLWADLREVLREIWRALTSPRRGGRKAF